MNKFIRAICTFLLAAILFPTVVNAEEQNHMDTEGLSVPSRVQTSIEINDKTFDEAKSENDAIIFVNQEHLFNIKNNGKKDIEHILSGYEIKEEQQDLNIPFKTINQNNDTLDKDITEINEVKKQDLYFIVQDLNLKEEPSATSKLLITIPKGTHLDYLSTEGTWHKVEYKNSTGYIPAKHVKKGTGYRVNNTLIVNKRYPLSSNFNPGINPEALNAVNKMKKDANKAGIQLNVFSDFRTYQYQVNLYNRYVKRDGKKKADTYSARPGYSEHQTGLTFDIGGANPKYYTSQDLGQMKEGLWMAENSYKYGLILRFPKDKEKVTGYNYEPWHFRYVGIDLSKKVKASGLTLDEYLKVVTPNYNS